MQPFGRMLLHATLLVALVTGAVSGVIMLAGYLVIVAGLGALLRQSRRSIELARWVAANGRPPARRLAAAMAQVASAGLVVQVDDDAPYAFTYGIWHPRIVVSTGLVAATCSRPA